MFNAVSRERLREIISAKFPTLEAFADVIYKDSGQTFVRLENGEWEIIPVTEGLTQGCPVSPVFAAIVLNDILSTIQQELNLRTEQRKINGEPGDDNLGTLGIILAYVDDCNVLLHHEDVLFFLDRFKQLAEPLGAVLNMEKTRILTSSTGSSLVSKLLLHQQMRMNMRGKLLKQAISKYSVKMVDGIPSSVEVTDGLRVLGAPIGSASFAQDFMHKIPHNAINDSQKLLAGLDDIQTMMRLFSSCTVHKITHLFSFDVFHTPLNAMPTLFYLWESTLCNSFTQMVENFIYQLTNVDHLPPHSSLISTLTVNQGGLGLQHPRANAITVYMTSSKRCLQYAFEGVWLGRDKPRPLLPQSITSLYTNWQTDPAKSWSIFRLYFPTFTSISMADASNDTDYIFKASLNGSREKLKEHSSRMMKRMSHSMRTSPQLIFVVSYHLSLTNEPLSHL
jgi:hypothetical protein